MNVRFRVVCGLPPSVMTEPPPTVRDDLGKLTFAIPLFIETMLAEQIRFVLVLLARIPLSMLAMDRLLSMGPSAMLAVPSMARAVVL